MGKHRSHQPKGPSQRQLRAGELVRHALVGILARGDLRDAALQGVSITVSEVRPSPDLRQAKVYVAPLGPADSTAMVAALNRAASHLRGRLGREIDMKFTPELHFYADTSYDTASEIDDLLARPEVRRDLESDPESEED
jgi:ribosome-binding factor A